MVVLALNCGSSFVKFGLFQVDPGVSAMTDCQPKGRLTIDLLTYLKALRPPPVPGTVSGRGGHATH